MRGDPALLRRRTFGDKDDVCTAAVDLLDDVRILVAVAPADDLQRGKALLQCPTCQFVVFLRRTIQEHPQSQLLTMCAQRLHQIDPGDPLHLYTAGSDHGSTVCQEHIKGFQQPCHLLFFPGPHHLTGVYGNKCKFFVLLYAGLDQRQQLLLCRHTQLYAEHRGFFHLFHRPYLLEYNNL